MSNRNFRDFEKFQESINKELVIIKDRVRNLIGNAHWGEEGRYKEAILRNIIKRYLPNNLSIGTGFILKQNGNIIESSKQIDIIIYDNTYPLLFFEGDFIITTRENVKGIIEVKTSVTISNLSSILSISETNGNFDNKIFNGIFVYKELRGITNGETLNNGIEETLKRRTGFVNHICIGEHIFIKYWAKDSGVGCNSAHYSVYKINNLSFSYFISNLVEKVTKKDLSDRYWYMYPIKDGKESYKIKEIKI